jgi:hypothetical protein
VSFASASGLAALVLCAGLVNAASAEDTAAPPAATQQPAAAAPALEAAAAEQAPCLEETDDFKTQGNKFVFVIGLTNTCEKRFKCKVYANVTGARGSSLGETTMLLGPKSSGAAAKKSYAMKVKAAGGTGQVSRQCQVY